MNMGRVKGLSVTNHIRIANQGYEWTFIALYVKVNVLIPQGDWILLPWFKTMYVFTFRSRRPLYVIICNSTFLRSPLHGTAL